MIDEILAKLLAKSPDARYQSAHGLVSDIQKCLRSLAHTGAIAPFTLGQEDFVDYLRKTDVLVGREGIMETLTKSIAFVESGVSQAVLLHGGSGTGKTSILDHLQRQLLPPRFLFCKGECEPGEHQTPFSGITRALNSLVRAV